MDSYSQIHVYLTAGKHKIQIAYNSLNKKIKRYSGLNNADLLEG